METITIPPGVNRELDVAFSVYGANQPGELGFITDTDTLPPTPNRPPTRGTLDVTLTPTGSRYIDIQNDNNSGLDEKPDPMKFSAWIASHEVLANPKEDSILHLSGREPPQRYHANIRVTCNEGIKDEKEIVLVVTPNPGGLT